jgi:hypothetical protein
MSCFDRSIATFRGVGETDGDARRGYLLQDWTAHKLGCRIQAEYGESEEQSRRLFCNSNERDVKGSTIS